ncbi:MAG TPA: hypothetical protein VF815_45300 [Myxococcaceae bacterium]
MKTIEPVAVLGQEESSGAARSNDLEARLERAEQLMVEWVAGCRSADEMRSDLAAYLDWLLQNPVMGGDLEKRHSEFFSWLRNRQ